MSITKTNVRIEQDSMGPMEVPADALYGASTMRAVLNFPISDIRFPRAFLQALGLVKLAAARTNMALGLLEEKVGTAVVQAAQEVADGKLDHHFVLDIFQTGSGTSTNTNANEVIANRASQILGGALGSRLVHPNDHVNLGQSSNDVIPTSMHLAALMSTHQDLVPALEGLKKQLQKKVSRVLAHRKDRTDPPARRYPGTARTRVPGLRWASGPKPPALGPDERSSGRSGSRWHRCGHRSKYPPRVRH